MSEMVERVAEVLRQRRFEALPDSKLLFEDVARAVIKEMHAPTDEMLEQMFVLHGRRRGADWEACRIWEAMIDEALK
jgi:hypothetical protein